MEGSTDAKKTFLCEEIHGGDAQSRLQTVPATSHQPCEFQTGLRAYRSQLPVVDHHLIQIRVRPKG